MLRRVVVGPTSCHNPASQRPGATRRRWTIHGLIAECFFPKARSMTFTAVTRHSAGGAGTLNAYLVLPHKPHECASSSRPRFHSSQVSIGIDRTMESCGFPYHQASER